MPLIWEIFLSIRVVPHWKTLKGWKVLLSLSVHNHILGVNLGLKEFAYLYEFRSNMSPSPFLLMIVAASL